jgi:hypothetical protein
MEPETEDGIHEIIFLGYAREVPENVSGLILERNCNKKKKWV